MEEKFDVLNEYVEFTGEIATRDECHKKGLWHRAVYAFISEIKIQKEEVSEVKYFSKDELLKRISNNYDGLTDKTRPWNFLERILKKEM